MVRVLDLYCFCGYNNNMAEKLKEEISKNYDVEKAITIAKSAAEEKEIPFVPAPVVGRGFAVFRENINKNGRPLKENKKKQINLRIDSDIVDFFQSTGAGWQTKINDSLRKVIQLREIIKTENN